MLQTRGSIPPGHIPTSAIDDLDHLTIEKMEVLEAFVEKIRSKLETGSWQAKYTIAIHELKEFIDDELAIAVEFVERQRFNMLVRQPVSMQGAQDHIDITRVLWLSHRNCFEVQYSA